MDKAPPPSCNASAAPSEEPLSQQKPEILGTTVFPLFPAGEQLRTDGELEERIGIVVRSPQPTRSHHVGADGAHSEVQPSACSYLSALSVLTASRQNLRREPDAAIAHLRICAGAPSDRRPYRDLPR